MRDDLDDIAAAMDRLCAVAVVAALVLVATMVAKVMWP